MSVWPLPRITFQELSTIEETRPVALLTSDEVWAVLGSQIRLPVLIQAEPSRYDRSLFEYLADHLPTQVQAVYVVGQGAPVQAGKVIASRNHKPLILVPTALDSNLFLTPTAEAVEESDEGPRRVVLETGPADEVILDWKVIQAAPPEKRGAGIVDVVCIVTGLLDWRHAAQKNRNPAEQRFSSWAASVAAGLAAQAIKSASAIGQGSRDALHTLLDLMMMGVQLCNQLGHTRACEGSEHFLADALANQLETAPDHSDLLAPCLLLASALHGQDPAALRDALENAGVRLDQLRGTDVRLVLDDLPNLLGAYGYPYSILNDVDPLSDTVTQALRAAGLAVDEDTWRVPVAADVEPEPAPEEAAAAPAAPGEATSGSSPALSDETQPAPEDASALLEEAPDAGAAGGPGSAEGSDPQPTH